MKHWQSVLWQVGALVLAASVVGLGANALRDARNHIDLTRNYFRMAKVVKPAGRNAPVKTSNETADRKPPAGELRDEPAEDTAAASGLQVMSFAEVMEAFNGDAYQDGMCIFIDARDDEHYQEGHIPLAYQLDHYRPDVYMEELRPIVQSADRIVVYCNGGDCEDSILAATYLIYDEDVPAERVYVFEGGMEEWEANDGPLTEGATP